MERRWDRRATNLNTENYNPSLHGLGWTATPFSLRLPVAGKAYTLTGQLTPFVPNHNFDRRSSDRSRSTEAWTEHPI
jgi:hypothetical protein